MLAYVYGVNGKLELREAPMPRQTEGNAIVRVRASSICGTDLRTFRFGSDKIRPPRIIGHELVGEIVSAGRKVRGFAVGDRVQVAPAIGCSSCRVCREGHPNLCDSLETIGFDYNGTFAEYMEIPEAAFDRGNVSPVEGRVPDTQAVLAEPIACIINAHQYLGIREGDVVAIFGSGFIGCMHAELASMSGASRTIVIEVNRTRADMARKLNPAIETLDPAATDLGKEIRDRTGGRGVDVAIVACSVGSAQSDAMSIAAKRGRVSLFGGLPKESLGFIDSNLIHYKEISVHGVHASSPAQNRQALRWIADGTLKVGQYSSSVFPLAEIERAFSELNSEHIMKAIIVPSE